MHVTAGNVHDSVPYLRRLDRQKERFGFDVDAVGLDAGYFTAGICKGLEERNIYRVVSYRRPTHRKDILYKREYRYDAEQDCYVCPADETLIYNTTDRNGYRHYQSNPANCLSCPLLKRCTQNAKGVKTVTRHVWEDSKERVNQHRLDPSGKKI